MDHNFIIQVLKEKEANLLNELQHVRAAMEGFIKENTEALFPKHGNYDLISELIPVAYEACNTYNSKILFILHKEEKPMMVDEIVAKIMIAEPLLDIKKLHNTISYSLSMLAKNGRVKKHPFNRHIKYSL